MIGGKQYIRESYSMSATYGSVTVTFNSVVRDDKPAIDTHELTCANQRVFSDQRLESVAITMGGQFWQEYNLTYHTQTHLLLLQPRRAAHRHTHERRAELPADGSSFDFAQDRLLARPR